MEHHRQVDVTVYDALGGDGGTIRVTYLPDDPDVNMPTTGLHILGPDASQPVYILGALGAIFVGVYVWAVLKNLMTKVSKSKIVTAYVPGTLGFVVAGAIVVFGLTWIRHLVAMVLF